MKELRLPNRLRKGDTVAAVSLSWGGAGDEDLIWRYRLGVKRLHDVFGLRVVEEKHTLAGSEYLYRNPRSRAEDLMAAFADPEVKGIFSVIGGDDSVRMLPYMDFDLIRQNPKILLGYSDTTVSHFICLHAGIRSYYGPSILAEFAENNEIYAYTRESVETALFSDRPIGTVALPDAWTGEMIPWTMQNRTVRKKMQPYAPVECLSGHGEVSGPLIGGCIEVMELLKGTVVWNVRDFDGAILFFETSEEMPTPDQLRYYLRNYGAQKILHNIAGMVFGTPYQNRYAEEYKSVIRQVLAEETLDSLPVLFGLPFGHTEPMTIIPYGALAVLSCEECRFSIAETACKAEHS